MPPKARITKELILEQAFEITRNEGIEYLNARSLAKALACSTMPIFKVFKDMNDLKGALKKMIDQYYDHFINQYLDKSNYLFSISYAYINFALHEPKLFQTLFITEFIQTRSIDEVINSSWNRETIEASAKQYQISISESEALYRDIRFYAHGIATQIYGGNIALSKEEIQSLLNNAITKFLTWKIYK